MSKKSAPELLVVLGKLTFEYEDLESIVYLLVREWGWKVIATVSNNVKRIYQEVAACATEVGGICS